MSYFLHIFTVKHNVMDIQTRKLNIISFVAQLKDESFISKIEEYILNNTQDGDISDDSIPFAVQEFVERIEQSERDFENGNYKTQSELEEIVKSW